MKMIAEGLSSKLTETEKEAIRNNISFYDKSVLRISNISVLKTIAGSFNGQIAVVAEYSAGTNIGGGVMVWNASSVAAGDDAMVFTVSGEISGRWLRLCDVLTAEKAGARPVAGFDNYSAFIRILSAGLPLILEGGKQYQCNTPLAYVGSKAVIQSSNDLAATIYHAGQTNDILSVSGSIDRTTTVAQSITIGSRSFTVTSTTGITSGKLLIIKSSKSWYFDPRPESTDARKSEIHVVSHVIGSVVYVLDAFNDGYDLTLETVEVSVISPINVSVSNIIFKGVLPTAATTTPRIVGFRMEYAVNSVLYNVSAEQCAGCGISIMHSYNTLSLGGYTVESNDYNSGYGLQTYGSRNTNISKRSARGCRRAVDVSGSNIISINTIVSECVAIGGGKNSQGSNYGWNPDASTGAYQAGFGSHGSADKTKYIGCITDNLHAHYSLRGGNEHIVNATAYGRSRTGVVQCGYGAGLIIDGLRAVTSFNNFKDLTLSDGGANINTRRADQLIVFDTTYNGLLSEVNISNVYAEVTEGGIFFNGELVQYLTVSNMELGIAPQLSTSEGVGIACLASGIRLASTWDLNNINMRRTSGTNRIRLLSNIEIRGTANRSSLVKTYRFQVQDDAVESIVLPLNLNTNQDGFTIHMTCTSGSCAGLFTVLENAATLYPSTGLLNINGLATIPTGTTGTDGRASVCLSEGKLYVENRLGSARNFAITVLSGI